MLITVCYLAAMFDAISSAGGDNRCYWQGGFFEAPRERLDVAPAPAVGASAGAFAGIYALLWTTGRWRTRPQPHPDPPGGMAWALSRDA
jgi:hypothetical protein